MTTSITGTARGGGRARRGAAGAGRLRPVRAGALPAASADASDLSWDAQALQSIGFTTDELGSAGLATGPPRRPRPAPKAAAGQPLRHRLVRFGFGKNALHGEAVVQTDEGTKTVVVQRGAVTAVAATSVTVKSTDGFTLTWTFGDPIHVVKDRAEAAPGADGRVPRSAWPAPRTARRPPPAWSSSAGPSSPAAPRAAITDVSVMVAAPWRPFTWRTRRTERLVRHVVAPR